MSQDSSHHHVSERAVNLVCCGVNRARALLAALGKLTEISAFVQGAETILVFFC